MWPTKKYTDKSGRGITLLKNLICHLTFTLIVFKVTYKLNNLENYKITICIV